MLGYHTRRSLVLLVWLTFWLGAAEARAERPIAFDGHDVSFSYDMTVTGEPQQVDAASRPYDPPAL